MFIAKPMGVVQSMGQKLYTQPFFNGDIVLMLICCVVLSPNPSSSSLPSSFFLLLPSPCSSLLKGLLQTAQSSQNSRGKLLRRHCSPEKRERGRGVGEREGGSEKGKGKDNTWMRTEKRGIYFGRGSEQSWRSVVVFAAAVYLHSHV